MKIQRKKIIAWIFYLVVISVCAQLLVTLIFSLDSTKNKIESFLASDLDIGKKIGTVQNAKLIRKVSFHGSNIEPPYLLYTFYVKGSRENARIIVRVDKALTADSNESYSIKLLEVDQ